MIKAVSLVIDNSTFVIRWKVQRKPCYGQYSYTYSISGMLNSDITDMIKPLSDICEEGTFVHIQHRFKRTYPVMMCKDVLIILKSRLLKTHTDRYGLNIGFESFFDYAEINSVKGFNQ